jgi:hypothetical protein
VDSLKAVLHTARVGWIHQDYGLSELDAYELLSKVAKIHLNEWSTRIMLLWHR